MRNSDNIISGKVEGNYKKYYNVEIDLDNRFNFKCDCKYSDGNKKICKHMISLLMYLYEENREKYRLECSFDEDYYDEEYYDDYYDDDYYYDDFVEPIFYDEIAKDFISNLTNEDIKRILNEEFLLNKNYYFNKYLMSDYNKIINDPNSIKGVIENINKRFNNFKFNNSCFDDGYNKVLIYDNEKEIIEENYQQMKEVIDRILIKPELSSYSDYKWIAKFFKQNNDRLDVDIYVQSLKNYLIELKQKNIKDSLCKSNVLISIYILSDFTLEEIAVSIIENAKYQEYCNYVLDNIYDVEKFYYIFDKKVEEIKYFDKEMIAKIYYRIYGMINNKDCYAKYLYYQFLFSHNIKLVQKLKENVDNYEFYFNKILNGKRNIVILKKMYIFLDMKKELFELLFNNDNDYSLIECTKYLKNDYSDELEKYYKKRFIEVVGKEKARKNYAKSSMYIRGLYRLKNGKELVNDFIIELKSLEYSNRRAMFDEIDKAILLEKNEYM